MIYHEGNCNDPCSSPLRSTGGRVGSYGYNQELYLLSPLRLEKFFYIFRRRGGGVRNFRLCCCIWLGPEWYIIEEHTVHGAACWSSIDPYEEDNV